MGGPGSGRHKGGNFARGVTSSRLAVDRMIERTQRLNKGKLKRQKQYKEKMETYDKLIAIAKKNFHL